MEKPIFELYENPSSPNVELGFYYKQPEQKAFQDFCRLLLNWGAKPLNMSRIIRGDNPEHFLFGGLADIVDLQLSSQELEQLINDKKCDVLLTFFADAVGSRVNTRECLQYNRISETAIGNDKHPISIVVDGTGIDIPNLDKKELENLFIAGEKIYRQFLRIIDNLDILYGAITIENSLSCPFDLHQDPTSSLFSDFFISDSLLSDTDKATIRDWYSGAFFMSLDKGIYISTTELYNPSREKWDVDIDHRWQMSKNISNHIGQKIK